ADDAAGVGVGYRFLHDLDQVTVLAAQVDVTRLGADGERRDHDAFNDSMRIMLEDQAVLARSGFALIAVAQHILWLGRLLGHKRPFQTGRKSRAAAATQVRRLYFVDD